MKLLSRRGLLRALPAAGFAFREACSYGSTGEALAKRIAADPSLGTTLVKAKELLKGALSAGAGYPEVWIRDLNTFIELALQVADPQSLRTALESFLIFQGVDGDVVDGYVPKQQLQEPAYRTSPILPQYVAHKNTVETDQESSLVLAAAKYIRNSGDEAWLSERVDGITVRERFANALAYPLTHRFDPELGLVWGGTTIDWGDVAPERYPGTHLLPDSHRAIGIYHNAMLVCAIRDYLAFPGASALDRQRWDPWLSTLKGNIQKHLWDAHRKQYRPHIYLDGSPFPASFREEDIYLHGGTAVAIEADLLSRKQVQQALVRMRANVKNARASSIGLTIYPPYPKGFYVDPILTDPYTYQNGGDWSWFGGRMVQQLIRFGFLEDAYAELKPMIVRVVRTGDFHEWWTPDDQPRGSAAFRGEAGVLGQAIQMLQAAAI